MSAMFTVSVQQDGYLLVVVSGPGNFVDFTGAVRLVETVVTGGGQQRALLDLTAAVPRLSRDEHERLGRLLAQALGNCRAAIGVPPEYRIGVGEQAAIAAGGQVQTFTSIVEAERWLLQH